MRPLLTILTLVLTQMAFGQGPSVPQKKVLHKNVLWLTLNGTLSFNDRWSVQADISHRRSDLAQYHDLSLVRIAPTYWLNPRFSLALAYAHLWSEAGVGNFDLILNENRIHEQGALALPLGKHTLNQRLRLEQRWREAQISGSNETRRFFTQRYRYQLSMNFRLSTQPRVPVLVIADEIMLQSGKEVQHGPFEQNRSYLALNQLLGEAFHLEVGYMYTWQQSLNGYVFNSINTLRATLFWTGRTRSGKQSGTDR